MFEKATTFFMLCGYCCVHRPREQLISKEMNDDYNDLELRFATDLGNSGF
jgi:hypothetical protein